jgi:hypothetical protein
MALHLNLKKILIDKCDVLQVNQTTDDAGQKSSGIDLLPLALDRPCRLIPMKGSRENTTETRLSVSRYNVFIMPPDGVDINEHLWLQVWQYIGKTWVGGKYYNIVDAPPQLMEGAPIELIVEEVRP